MAFVNPYEIDKKIEEKLFYEFCLESGMTVNDVNATSWRKAGMIDYTKWLIEKLNQTK